LWAAMEGIRSWMVRIAELAAATGLVGDYDECDDDGESSSSRRPPPPAHLPLPPQSAFRC
jgi:hypothetical protein